MKKLLKILHNHYFLLLIVILLGVFLREYDSIGRFGFSHDADLFSWIVKDIALDHHFRLIGQETSTQGIFIGPLFYYLLIPFFAITHWDPVGALFLSALIGIATIISFYFVFRKLFDKQVGLVAAFFQAILLFRVDHDRWIVPTITDYLWEIWYFYTILMVSRGNFSVMWLLGLLLGLIWHINFSLAVLMILIPLALIQAKKIPKLIYWLQFGIGLLIPSVPLILFELRHNFLQSKSFILSFLIYQGGERGFYRIIHVLDEATKNSINLILFSDQRQFIPNLLIFLFYLIIAFFLTRKRYISTKILNIFYIWVFSTLVFFMLSSKILSEYYFSSVYMILIAILILFFSYLLSQSGFIKKMVLLFLILFSLNSIYHIVKIPGYNNEGYNEKKAVVNFISEDSKTKNYPCVAVSYITNPGEDVGFRYFFFLRNLHVNQPKSQSPDYTIVIPASLASNSVKIQFGAIGIIPPSLTKVNQKLINSCSGENSNLTDPFFGFTQ